MNGQKYLIRTKSSPHFYVCEIRGAVFVTWVSSNDIEFALKFDGSDVRNWENNVSDTSDTDVESVSI